MRISTAQFFQSGIDTIQRSHAKLTRTGLQLATGRRILTPSDDPGGAAHAARLDTRLQATAQYQRNADLARPSLAHEEWAIAGMQEQLQRVRELLVAANNEPQTDATRRYMAGEIRQIRDGLFDLGNTKDPNGEYLFAGTRSLVLPFTKSNGGVVSYVGAEGEGSVRELAITPTRQLAIGDTGAKVFMDIPENDARISADLTRAGAPPRGSLVIERTEVSDLALFLTGTNSTDEFRIDFQYNANDDIEYRVTNVTQGGAVVTPFTEYLKPGAPEPFADFPKRIDFAGRSVYLSGIPTVADEAAPGDPGDTVTSRPARTVSVFETLATIAEALEQGIGGPASRADLLNAANRGLADLDATMNHLSEIRATVGTRLQALDDQQGLNADRTLNLRAALSEIQDLDYAEAISRFQLQQVTLTAAQQSYTQVSRLSLFNFI